MSYLRRAIISIAQVVALILVFAFTIGGMQLADAVAQFSFAAGQPRSFYASPILIFDGKIYTLYTLIGGFVGFSIALMLTATFLVLVEIARNTRS